MQSLPCLKQPILWNDNWNQLLYNLCKKKNHNQFVQACSAVRLCVCFCGFTNMLQPDFFFTTNSWWLYTQKQWSIIVLFVVVVVFAVIDEILDVKWFQNYTHLCELCNTWHRAILITGILIENLNSTNNKQLWSLVTVKKVGTCTWKYRCTKNDSLVKWLKKTNYSLLCLSAK